jgi:hypothetical protein
MPSSEAQRGGQGRGGGLRRLEDTEFLPEESSSQPSLQGARIQPAALQVPPHHTSESSKAVGMDLPVGSICAWCCLTGLRALVCQSVSSLSHHSHTHPTLASPPPGSGFCPFFSFFIGKAGKGEVPVSFPPKKLVKIISLLRFLTLTIAQSHERR